jgi:hypothetical protein
MNPEAGSTPLELLDATFSVLPVVLSGVIYIETFRASLTPQLQTS